MAALSQAHLGARSVAQLLDRKGQKGLGPAAAVEGSIHHFQRALGCVQIYLRVSALGMRYKKGIQFAITALLPGATLGARAGSVERQRINLEDSLARSQSWYVR